MANGAFGQVRLAKDNVTDEEVKEDNIESIDSSQLVDEECGRSECT